MPSLTAADIRARLAGTTLPDDPLHVAGSTTLDRFPEQLRRQLTQNLRAAGVLVPLIERPSSLSVLLTQRAAHLKQHGGQISFPGGGMEPADADVRATALRETWEEIGIRPEQVEIAGYLQPSPTISGYAVTPVVGLVASGYTLQVDETEVEQVFEVPLEFLLDVRNERQRERQIGGIRVPVPEFHHGGRRIWGATAAILVMLRSHLEI